MANEITVSKGVTISVAKYEFVRLDVSITSEYGGDFGMSAREATREANSFVDAELNRQIAEVVKEWDIVAIPKIGGKAEAKVKKPVKKKRRK